MNLEIYLVFFVSIVLSVGRNIFSKNISEFQFGSKRFFYTQFLIFAFGAIFLATPAILQKTGLSFLTVLYAIIYAILLISAQWGYTIALKTGNVSVCVTIYSLGFILPTVSGYLFWNEMFTIRSLLGVITVILAVLVSGTRNHSKDKNGYKTNYILPLIIAMLSSGGLGIMQKIQQSSQYSSQRSKFIFIAFLIACVVSLICALYTPKENKKYNTDKAISAALAGLCFGCCNLANTFLAGKLKSSFFFPIQNISIILFSYILSVLLFREKPRRKEILVMLMGIFAIILLTK